MVKPYAWVNKSTCLIENMIMWDGEQPLVLPDGYEIIEAPEIHGKWSWLGIGWAYSNGQFIEPPAPLTPPVQQQLTGTTPNVIA